MTPKPLITPITLSKSILKLSVLVCFIYIESTNTKIPNYITKAGYFTITYALYRNSMLLKLLFKTKTGNIRYLKSKISLYPQSLMLILKTSYQFGNSFPFFYIILLTMMFLTFLLVVPSPSIQSMLGQYLLNIHLLLSCMQDLHLLK